MARSTVLSSLSERTYTVLRYGPLSIHPGFVWLEVSTQTRRQQEGLKDLDKQWYIAINAVTPQSFKPTAYKALCGALQAFIAMEIS